MRGSRSALFEEIAALGEVDPGVGRIRSLAMSEDGRWLAFIRATSWFHSDLYAIDLGSPEREEIRLTSWGRWTAGGRYSTR